MTKEHGMPELTDELCEMGLLGDKRRTWISEAQWIVEMFGREEASLINEDLELWRKMPGWFAIGQDADDSLLCVDSKTGRCAMVEVDDICKNSAQEIAKSLAGFLALGSWKEAR